MSLIKELVDLATQLDKSISDRKIRDLFLPLKEKILDVQREQFRLEQQHAAEMAALKQAHTEEVAKLKQRTPQQIEKPHFKQLLPEQEKILAFVAVEDGATTEQVAKHFDVSGQLAQFHIGELAEAELLESYYGDKYHANQNARRLLVSKGLLE